MSIMKRLLFFSSVVLITVSVAAQTIDFTNIQITEENVHTKVLKKKYSFVSLDYGFVSYQNYLGSGSGDIDNRYQLPSKLSHAIGFSIGQVRQWGWYANVMFGTHMKIERHTQLAQDQNAQPYNSCFSIVPGIMCRCGIPLYAFVGIGYGYQATNMLKRQPRYWGGDGSLGDWHWIVNEDGYYVEDPDYFGYGELEEQPKNIHTVAWQVGFMGIIKCVTIKATLNGIGPCVGAEFGIGYAYEHKK